MEMEIVMKTAVKNQVDSIGGPGFSGSSGCELGSTVAVDAGESAIGGACVLSGARKEDCRSVVSYNIFMRGLFENAKVDEAISIWKLLPEKGCVGDSITYSVLIHGLCKNGYLNRVLWVLNEAEDKGDRLDISAYSSMINGLCREGQLDEVITMLDRMAKRGCKPNAHVCNTLINDY
ncbi:hypothetical protein F0562_029370 [Nyssa sinensis]|uniref:Pentatricopeptide repeat-containing protein n=1 Tax=Nyssa sinensis TaxID=561372 RepID=A0A5J5B4U4_9ASTE|nr:hypothetical protein F0562_029370 [Nyssa sinensis]